MAKLPSAAAGARIVGERFVRSQRQQNPEGRVRVLHPGVASNRAPAVLGGNPRGSWMRHARGQSARPSRSARLV